MGGRVKSPCGNEKDAPGPIKCTKNEKTQEIFPKREKEHEMQARNEEKYHVQHAKTNRLKNSAIPYMQRLLNENLNQRKRMPG